MKILVTGGAGFIASHIVDAYIDLGHEVIVVDNLSTGIKEFINKKAIFIKADITRKKEITDIILSEKPEVINHHAAQISVRLSTEVPQSDARINIIGLLNILEAAKQIRLKKLIFASSGGAIYGDAHKFPTPESYSPLLPISPYGITKLTSELYLHYYNKSFHIPYIALRYSNVYGPRQNPLGEAGVIAIFSLKLLKQNPPVINGDGYQTRDYIYISDVVDANIRSLDNNFIGSINIGTGIETDVTSIFSNLKIITKSKVTADHGPMKTGEQKRSCLNTRLSQKVLCWKAIISLIEGLHKTVGYFKSYEK